MSEGNVALQKQLYGIGIFEEEIVLSDFTAGAERRFCVTPEQLMDFFRTEVMFRPFPWLVWMSSNGSGETTLLTLPAAERSLLYRRGRKANRKGRKKDDGVIVVKLKLPAIAAMVKVDAATRKIGTISLWGFAGKTLVDDSVLYELPLPNLSRSSLCLGSVEKAEAGADLRTAVETMVFDTPFNHHNNIVGSEKLTFQDYAAKYRGRCPLKTLNVIGRGGDILRGPQ